jgi:two-component system NtrC family sensor kinase
VFLLQYEYGYLFLIVIEDDTMTEHPAYKQARAKNGTGNEAHRQALARIAELEAEVATLKSREASAQRRIADLEARLADTTSHPGTDARLNSLLAVGAALLITHEIDTVLDLVVRESTNLFPGTSGAMLLLHDPETQQLMLRTISNGPITQLTLNATPELLSHAFLSPRAMLLAGSELEAIFDQLRVQEDGMLQELLALWPPSSVLLAPLRDEDRRMGALILYRSTPDLLYHSQDLPFIQALADLAAVAITETYQRARAAALQRDLAQTQFLHKEAQARLDTAQAQLLQSAKLAAVGELAASVAHEINNPLYAARNSLYLIAQDMPLGSPQQQFLDIAQGELGRIARIITRMREFYRPSRAELTITDVNSLLRDTVDFVQTYLRHSQIAVTTDFDHAVPDITAHMDQLRQVFLNLVLNACDAMRNGGSLQVSTRTLHATADQLAGVVVQVTDTGTGIPEEHMPHLFEPFYTTKPQGTGLGLAISAHIVTQHGGQIMVDSTVGLGSTFTITLPVINHIDPVDAPEP